MIFFIRLPILKPSNKMGWFNVNTYIYGMQPRLLCFICMYSSIYGQCYSHRIFFINHMPSFVLQDMVTFSCLYLHKKKISLTPQVFGCICFMHNLSPWLDKLAPCAIKCVFDGYSHKQEGYKCNDHRLTNFMCDVTIFQNKLYFSTSRSPKLQPPPLPSCPVILLPPHPSPTKPLQVYTHH